MKQAVDLLRALGDEERLRIVSLLAGESEGACVCELVDALRLPQYQVSRQLAVLRDAGLVKSEKRGYWVYYRVSSDLTPLAAAVLEAVKANLESETAREDKERLERRLRLRTDGVCRLGYPSEAPYREFIPLEEVGSREGDA